jgi:diaminopimelate epimerase
MTVRLDTQPAAVPPADPQTADAEPAAVGPVLHVAKYHGIGNDFLVALEPEVEPDAALARRLCDRRRGLGADGLIVGRRIEGDKEALSFRLFNADGSEAEMSGNGMRCLAHAALDAGIVGEGSVFTVATPAGRRLVVTERRGRDETWASVEMGQAVVGGDADRCNVGHGELHVDMGNPHLVVAGPDPRSVDVAALGPRLAAGAPAGLNVEFVTLGPGPDELTMRVWERGVGETEACGTGSCAAAVAFRHWGRVGPSVTVHQPGGAVAVVVGDDLSVRLSGPSQWVAACTVTAVP